MAKRIVIIGGGPAGYVAAIRGAQLGAQVTLIEKDTLGGTCLNRGCIPTKFLLQAADILVRMKSARDFGILAERISFDFLTVVKRKEVVVKQLLAGLTSLMKKNKIEVIKGSGTLIDPKTVGILEVGRKINADNIIVATGSRPSTVPIRTITESGIISSDEALTMEQLPKSIIIIGGGVIGLEFAQIFRRMGSEVTIIEAMPQILPGEDIEIVNMLRGILEADGINIFTNAIATAISSTKSGEKVVSFTTVGTNNVQERKAEKVLVAVGRSPNIDNLGVDKLGLATDKGRLVVNERMETNIPGIFAAGDVVGAPMLAHVAQEEGKCAVENIMGFERKIDYRAIPRVVYTSPEVAAVGLTETQAKKEYGDIKIGRFPFRANSRAVILNETKGMVKIIADAKHGQILGVHILGPWATELIAEAVIAIRMEATFRDIASSIHAHPTLSEAVAEASWGVEGESIHI